jgi:Bacterial dnaA protein helix-turn-helix
MKEREATRGNHPARTNPVDLDRAALIIQLVCKHFNCSTEDLESHSRAEQYAWPRYIALRMIKAHTAIRMSVLGALFCRSMPEIFSALNNPLSPRDPRNNEINTIALQVEKHLPGLNPVPV